MRKVKISPFGFWLSSVKHYFDENLAYSCLNLARAEGCKDAYDMGCGSGLYCNLFNERGFPTIGIDGNPSTAGENLIIANLAESLYLEPRDFVLCLETGEHIPKEFEETFVKNIATHCNKILVLSWARPGQGGHGHINCKKPEDVIKSFEAFGFIPMDQVRKTMKKAIKLGWLKKNILVLKRNQSCIEAAASNHSSTV